MKNSEHNKSFNIKSDIEVSHRFLISYIQIPQPEIKTSKLLFCAIIHREDVVQAALSLIIEYIVLCMHSWCW